MEHHLNYRPDIDVLRAVSVLGVLLFHLDIPLFQAGFLGVDVFFVISGFLMTSIIQKEMVHKDFSFIAFFKRRAMRIFPALFTVITVTMLACLFILPPEPLRSAGKEGLAAVFAVSNILFWLQSGYFDTASLYKPLLHTWSLGVEEQFYVIWPVTLVLLAGLALSQRRAAIAAIGLVSAIAAVLVQTEILWSIFPAVPYVEGESAAFFLMPFRIWEFCLGALVASQFIPRLVASGSLKLLGYGGLIAIYTVATWLAEFPSFVGSLIACIGALCVLATASSARITRMLTFAPLLYVGKASYAIYLVHWPLIVLYKWATGFDLSGIEMVGLLVLSLLVGAALHHGVEKPLRYARFEVPRLNPIWVRSSVFASLLVLAGGSALAARTGFGFVMPPVQLPSVQTLKARAVSEFGFDPTRCGLEVFLEHRNDTGCIYDNAINILTIGNSHEPHSYGLLRNLLPREIDGKAVNLVFAGTHERSQYVGDAGFRCHFPRLSALPLASQNAACQTLAAYLNKPETAHDYDALVIGAYKPMTFARIYFDLAVRMQKDNPALKVIVVGSALGLQEKYKCHDLAELYGDLSVCARGGYVGYMNAREEEEIRSKWPALKFFYINQLSALCADNRPESCNLSFQNVPLFYDAHHFHEMGTVAMLATLRARGERERLVRFLSSRLIKLDDF